MTRPRHIPKDPERYDGEAPFTSHRMDLARPEARAARPGQVLVAMMVATATLGLAAIAWTLWGAL